MVSKIFLLIVIFTAMIDTAYLRMWNYINNIDGNNSMDKFIYIMKYKEIPTSNAIGKKIHNYFQKRESS